MVSLVRCDIWYRFLIFAFFLISTNLLHLWLVRVGANLNVYVADVAVNVYLGNVCSIMEA